MATVAHDAKLAERIDAFLDYSLKEWGAIPEIAHEWVAWNAGDRRDFVLEWPIREDRLKQLDAWRADDFLTVQQRHRYDQLSKLVSMHRPIILRILAIGAGANTVA